MGKINSKPKAHVDIDLDAEEYYKSKILKRKMIVCSVYNRCAILFKMINFRKTSSETGEAMVDGSTNREKIILDNIGMWKKMDIYFQSNLVEAVCIG